MLNSRQRAQLRALANTIDTIVIIGKGGITETLVKQADDALTSRELIKGKVLTETSPISPREAADTLAQSTGADTVQVIGGKFVLYRRSEKVEKEKRIRLVK